MHLTPQPYHMVIVSQLHGELVDVQNGIASCCEHQYLHHAAVCLPIHCVTAAVVYLKKNASVLPRALQVTACDANLPWIVDAACIPDAAELRVDL